MGPYFVLLQLLTNLPIQVVWYLGVKKCLHAYTQTLTLML